MLRKTMIPLALLIVVVVGFSQEMPYDIVWSRCYGWGEISGSYINVLDSGNMILSGYSERTHLYKLNPDGDTIISRCDGIGRYNVNTSTFIEGDSILYVTHEYLETSWDTPDFMDGHYIAGFCSYDTSLINREIRREILNLYRHEYVQGIYVDENRQKYLCGSKSRDYRTSSAFNFSELILDSTDIIIRNLEFGGADFDRGKDIYVDESVNLYVLCQTASSSGVVPENNGCEDVWIYRKNPDGEFSGSWGFGGSGSDLAERFIPSREGGFLVVGTTSSSDSIFSMNKGLSDVFLLRIDEAGEMLWANTYGGSSFDHGKNVIETENGYVIVGSTYSNDYDVSGYHGNSDGWVFGVDFDGNLLWQRCFGGSGADILKDIDLCPDGSIVVAGQTCSSDGDIYDPVYGSALWAMKLATPEAVHENDGLPDNLSLSAYPNPFNSSLRIDAPTNATSVSICDIRGIKIAEFECKSNKSITWQAGPDISSGIYLVSAFQAGELINTVKVTLIR